MSGMRAARRAGPARPRWVTTVSAVTLPAVVATLAILYPGARVSQFDLNDGAVWLTNTSALKVGRYNPAVEELNAGLVATSAGFDVLQDGSDVLLVERGRIGLVDPAEVMLTAQTTVPPAAVVSMAGGTTAVWDPDSGDVWARPTSAIGSLSLAAPADLALGPQGGAVVARSGLVLAAEADGTAYTLQAGPAGSTVTRAPRLAGDLTGIDQVTAVGDELIVLDGARLRTAHGDVDLTRFGDDLRLQQPGPQATTVLVATRTALLQVPIDGGAVREHVTGGSGRPADPVLVGACAHAAWASVTGSYLQLCDDADPTVVDLEGMTTADRLVFRVNRDVVVLNDVLAGRVWLPTEDLELREPNWQDVEAQEQDEQADSDTTARQDTQNLQAQCTGQSAPPTATADDYGVRPGRTTILSVIDNDAASDCGILAISEHDPLPETFGTLVPVYGGRGLQLTTLPDASGTVEFTYTVTDGRGSSAPSTATVRLTVREGNAAPEQLRVASVLVEQGASVTYDVLPDFRDPDGDQLMLTGAAAESGGTVSTRQDGELTFQSDGSVLGRHTVRVLVSDGALSVDGTLFVEIRPVGSVPPAIEPVHAVTYVDQPVVLHPLDSVRSTAREPVRLAAVDEVSGARIDVDLDAGTFTVSAATASTYYVPFTVTAGPQQAAGLARIDVRERPEEAQPPIAVLDTALLPPGGEVTVDPLANDVDPAGGVLVLQSVDVPAETGLRVAVIGHQLLRITATRTLESPVTARYTISNGSASATGEIVVLPVPASAGQQPPVVPAVAASVRTGGVVTIPVLQRAYDPDGDPLTLQPALAEPPGPEEGLMFVSGDVLRYQAPATPMEVHATFAVSDPTGNVTAATVTVSVHDSEAEAKAPPRPLPLTARVFEGETVRIPVPLTGIDPDGDGVALLGPDRAPAMGVITEVGPDWMEYRALPGELGTDTFTYAVEDWVGQRAVATVRVGIAPQPTASAQVVSRNDDVTVRPGQTVEVRVLANDVDTGGGELTLDPQLETADGVDARVEGRRVVVRAPATDGVLQISYTARNDRGGRDSAVLTVTVSQDAPILPPVARDVVVPATDTINRTSVEVDVLAVAENPSGPLSDLAVSVHGSVADVATVTARGTVVVTLVDHAQTLPYLLTNTDPRAAGVSSYAFITVSALGDFPPVRRPGAPDLLVIAGERLPISLAEQVQVAPGRTARIADPTKVSATKTDGSPLVVDEHTLAYTAQGGYAGPASISFEVTDGALGDVGAHTTVMTLPVTVLAAEDHPPRFTPSVLDVAPAESARVDLTAFTSAPVATAEGTTQYTYRLTSPPPQGFSVALEGTVLTVSAAATVPRGTVGGVSLVIGYGGTATVAATVDFRVVASSRPLARLVDHTFPDGVEGGSSRLPVLDGAFNPFPGQPLSVMSAVVETPGAGTVTVSGTEVTVRPAVGFLGPMVARYRVRDITGDPDREVEGRVTVIVRGRPAAPTAPRAVEVRDRTVVLTWDAPANNGAPITDYQVTVQPGATPRDCAATTCTIDALTNDVEYTFTVAAHNAVGWSDPSPASAPARPDAKPFAPAAPRLDWGDGSVTATWQAPQNPGSPITRYDVEISPSGGRTLTSTTSTSATFTGLANGTEYVVRVRAVNNAPEPGDWSPWSAPQVPARRPDPPAPAATRLGVPLNGTGRIDVTWSPPEGNGDAVAEYQVKVDDGESLSVGAATSYAIQPANAREYQISVRARNKAGWSDWATTTGEVWAAPSPPQLTAAHDAAQADTPWGSGRVNLTWQPPSDTGGERVWVTEYEIEDWGRVAATSATINNLRGGTAYIFRVRAWNNRGAASDWAVFPTVVPTTVPDVPDVSLDTTQPHQVRATWGTRADGTGGPQITRYRYRLQGQTWEEVGTETSRTFNAPGGSTFRIEVAALNERGWSESTYREVVVPEQPPTGG